MKLWEIIQLGEHVAEAVETVKAQVQGAAVGEQIRLPGVKGLHLFGRTLDLTLGSVTVRK